MRTTACDLSFKKHSDKGGLLQEKDTLSFCQEVCGKLGVTLPLEKLQGYTAQAHRVHAGPDGLARENFAKVFEHFLRQLSSKLREDSESSPKGGEMSMMEGEAPLAIRKAVDDFKVIVESGDWAGRIQITIEDAGALQRRV